MFNAAAQFLQSKRHLCIASHVNPDGDAIGSTLAMGLGLTDLGRRIVMFNQDGVPSGLRFLPGSDQITKHIPTPAQCDALVLLDCSELDRAGDAVAELAQHMPVLVIDHHLQKEVPPGAHCIDSKAAATAELVYHVLRATGAQITPDMATALYCGLATDTGQFRYANTTASTLRLAGELVALGAEPWRIASALTEQQNPAVLRLLPMVLETLELHCDGRCALLTMAQEMLFEARATPDLAEDFINYGRSLAGVEVALFCKETPDRTQWKVSLRSRQVVDVARIARQFGGGGHYHAAGCTLTGNLATVRATILEAVRIHLTEKSVAV